MTRRIAHITDTHLDEEFPESHGVKTRSRFDTILKDIEQQGISEIICTGDIGEKEGIAYFFKQLESTALSITLGNHDSYREIHKHHQQPSHLYHSKIYSSTQDEYYKFIYLDSSSNSIDKQQLVWLSSELISPKPIIIFIHHPVLGLNLKVDEIGRLENRSELLQLLENSSSKITIFCGHYHMSSNTEYENITQYITPAVSYQIVGNPDIIVLDTQTFGYRIIELDGKGISTRVQSFSNAD